MPRSKRIQELMRKLLRSSSLEKRYEVICKALGLQLTTVTDVIHNRWKRGTVVNLPISGRSTKNDPKSAGTTIPRTRKTTEILDFRPQLPQFSSDRVPKWKLLLSKKNIETRLNLARKYLHDHKRLYVKTLRMRQKCSFLDGISEKEHDTNSRIWWWECDGLGLFCRTWKTLFDQWNHEFHRLETKHPEGEHLVSSRWSKLDPKHTSKSISECPEAKQNEEL